ncbi:hypothetical protein [Streptacidiphilus sp. EB129]|jgi:hypothetical protein|uniref:hypothetical protein n=1 Tax=Streptacidiphilus sp. EB129 TaxID=3156262 RepID=UPI003517AE24
MSTAGMSIEERDTGPELPEGPVRQLVDAVRRGDARAFADLFATDGAIDDCAIDDWGRVFVGRDRVEFWNSSEFMGLDGRLTIRHVALEEHPVLTVDIATTGGYNGPGRLTFVLTGDGRRIHRLLMTD